jgi:hypothetical protein
MSTSVIDTIQTGIVPIVSNENKTKATFDKLSVRSPVDTDPEPVPNPTESSQVVIVKPTLTVVQKVKKLLRLGAAPIDQETKKILLKEHYYTMIMFHLT